MAAGGGLGPGGTIGAHRNRRASRAELFECNCTLTVNARCSYGKHGASSRIWHRGSPVSQALLPLISRIDMAYVSGA
eukprot:scaffold36829_cov29-Tisochrysis_lutea.AAC.2